MVQGSAGVFGPEQARQRARHPVRVGCTQWMHEDSGVLWD